MRTLTLGHTDNTLGGPWNDVVVLSELLWHWQWARMLDRLLDDYRAIIWDRLRAARVGEAWERLCSIVAVLKFGRGSVWLFPIVWREGQGGLV